MSHVAASRQKGAAGSGQRSFTAIVLVPAMLFVVGVAGLVAALVGDGPWDVGGAAALGLLVVLPVVLALRP